MAEARTSVAVNPAIKRRIKKLALAAKPPMGWTVLFAILAEEGLEAREKLVKAPT